MLHSLFTLISMHVKQCRNIKTIFDKRGTYLMEFHINFGRLSGYCLVTRFLLLFYDLAYHAKCSFGRMQKRSSGRIQKCNFKIQARCNFGFHARCNFKIHARCNFEIHARCNFRIHTRCNFRMHAKMHFFTQGDSSK